MALSLSRHAPATTPDEDDIVYIDLLGSISLVVSGGRTELRARKIRTMLAMLALQAEHTVYHNELSEDLWPGEVLKNPLNALQAQATRIRRIVGKSIELRAVQNGYLLDIPRDTVDANRFLDYTARGFRDLTSDPRRALRSLQQGLQLWRGPALLNTHTGEHCRSAAAFLEEQRALAWEDLVTAHLLIGDNRQASVELQRLLAANPLRERLCELLMLALYRSGRQSEALHLFHRTRQRLDAELGVEPGRALLRLYEGILAQDHALDSARAVLKRAEGDLRPIPKNRLTA